MAPSAEGRNRKPDGALPAITAATAWLLISPLGLVGVAVAYTAGRFGKEWSHTGFWVAVTMVFLPVAAVVSACALSRLARLAVVVALTLEVYLIKFLYSPFFFSFHDEFAHWRTAHDISSSNQLFVENSLNPPSAFFPGLEIVASFLSESTNVSLFVAGSIIIGLAKFILTVFLFLLLERLSGSDWLAAVGTLVYIGNSNFVFFGSYFAYESLALPLATFVIYMAIHASGTPFQWLVWTVLAAVGGAAVVATHHLTSYFLAAFFAATLFVALLRRTPRRLALAIPAVISLVLAVGWLKLLGSAATGYLSPHLIAAGEDLVSLIAGEERRRLFTAAGRVAPLWDRLVGVGATALVLGALVVGLYRARSTLRGLHPAALVFLAGASLFPVALLLRFTSGGQEIATRTSEFIYIGIALAVAPLASLIISRRISKAIMIVSLTIIFLGGISTGFAFYVRVPGPYLIAATPRSIDRHSLLAAEWMRTGLGVGNRVASDQTNKLILGSYGRQYSLASISSVNVSPLFFGETMGEQQRLVLRESRAEFIMVDIRLSTGLPWNRYYIESGEPNGGAHRVPISRRALKKFDRVQGISRVFDDGTIRIYGVDSIRNP